MNSSNNANFAVVTGASQGLGKAFAMELAKKNHNLILTSLPGEGLGQLAKSLEEMGCTVHYRETDLTKTANVMELTAWVNNFELDILINNVGFGGNKRFLDVDAGYIGKMLDLNVKATSLITHQLLPNLLKGERSYVLNVSSMAAWCPIAYKTVYPASKAFVYSLTRSLQNEFTDKQISFSVLNPGPMKTNGDVSARLETQGFAAKLLLIPPSEIARISLRQLFRRKKVIKLNWAHRLGWFLLHVLPVSAKSAILSNNAKKELERAEQ
ncbi:SDR family NAD(P)-dependent oxidoreductase [Zunongwangia sp. F363]|uniref:SDR family NAD(P)-dependent oxidoreductase n=1 Tax=Autumnicola tepida TaxID=3075595 RepID=A0ABU3CC50_9FLAO|nr:SDR family NAD(P)-dependent oxidoreductase [Zunongwangia sp. F363]MDT0643904.1 SDR family NAD(P)-dependent oxidoreductase [Zunongwangia sp. F363]